MPTKRQENALKKMVENGGNVSKAMREAGYSPATAKTPSKLLDSAGFIELMDKLGLTDDLIVNALVEDIGSKKGNRVAELGLAVKMRGRIIEKADITSNGKELGDISAERAEQLIRARANRGDL
jgi:hypothetical protein